MLQATGLVKRYGDHTAVDGIDLAVPEGACYGLLGPNGAGKTTTISMLVGVLLARRGHGDARRQSRGEGADRLRAAGPRPLRRTHRVGEPAVLRDAVRSRGRAARRPDRRRARPRAPSGPGEGADLGVQRRHEAAAQHRGRAPARPRSHRPRRADGGRGPAEPERDLRRAGNPARGGEDAALHDALHGGGRAAVRPDRDHGRRSDRRGGHPGRASAGRARATPPPRRTGVGRLRCPRWSVFPASSASNAGSGR